MRAVIVVLLAGCPHSKGPPPAPAEPTDFSQAERMLELFSAKPATDAQLDAVMAAPGTGLIVKQQNLQRKVTTAQYRAVLAAYAAEAAPAVAPVDDGERARMGAAGLHDEVWPILHWGASHTGELAGHVEALRKLELAPAARKLALEWLPERTPPEVHLHVVMGGRAGAAAIDHDIYFDVLATSFKASLGPPAYPSDGEITEYFAHETHHVGLADFIDKRRAMLNLGDGEQHAYDLLAGLVTEGSATYFINAHHDLARMQADPQYADHLADPQRLLATVERLLDDSVNHGLTGDSYDKAIAPLVQSGFHAAGALILDAVYRTDGKKGILAIMRDPRQLLVEFNIAAVELSAKGSTLKPFDGAITERVAHLGGP